MAAVNNDEEYHSQSFQHRRRFAPSLVVTRARARTTMDDSHCHDMIYLLLFIKHSTTVTLTFPALQHVIDDG
jgi:hypothetical protein